MLYPVGEKFSGVNLKPGNGSYFCETKKNGLIKKETTMRKWMVAACFALLAGSTLSAQEGGNAPRMRTDPGQMAKRMAGKLMLDDETSAKFIPLYEEYMQKLAECRIPGKKMGSQAAQSDKDIDENIKARFSAQERRLDVQKSYYDKFKKVLTMRQVQQLYERPDMGSRPRFQGQRQHPAPRR
ncbi:conserved domain protein [Paraprevotella xylaniphila YIT 11841]|uniref:Conserved domain protein n=2 Tax=Paraprevotella xylaniphila TaxID=454155 RepID=F3QUJ5_9BACT|nr:conserved domain protein [Paraprevotella xylaniphila YIT 11841]